MTDPNLALVRVVFEKAVRQPLPARQALLDRECGEDRALRREVERLLSAYDSQGLFDSEGPDSESATESTLEAGTRLGPYAIEALIGAGGMGEVYRARDTRLHRPVAVKVLSNNRSEDPIARHRFEREARAVAALSHPHICPIFDVGRQGRRDYLVMEYLPGETLARRLTGGRLAVREAVRLAVQIASALAAAHAAGIIHRDLKPGNVMLTSTGVRLLDFGLARAIETSDGEAATSTIPEPLTGTGMIVGTLAYMAPEQIEGRTADARTDVFAFGVVLYEMLTGRRAFGGSSHAALASCILRDDPPSLTTLDPRLPPALDRVVQKCLEKSPSSRWQTVAEIMTRLEALQDVGTVDLTNESLAGRRWKGTWSAVAVGVLLLAALGAVAISRRPSPETTANGAAQPASPSVTRNLTRLTFDAGLQTDPAYSPDGRFLAYAADRNGNFDIYVQALSGGDPIRVTKTAATDLQPSWSSDGNTIAFRSERDGGGIYVVPAFGGSERRIVGEGTHPWWSPDGTELRYLIEPFGNSSCLLRSVALAGDEPRDFLQQFRATGSWVWIGPSPDGRTSFLGSGDQGRGFYTVSESRVVQSDLTAVRESLANVYGGQASIFAEARFQWKSDRSAILLQTRSADGIRNLWRVTVDPNTLKWNRIERLTTGSGSFVAGTYASDGRHVAFSIQTESEQLWEYMLTPKGLGDGRALTESGASALGGDVSQDGSTLMYQLVRPGGAASPSFWIASRGRPAVELAGVQGLYQARLAPDGQRFAYLKLRPRQGREFDAALAVRSLDGSERQLSPWQRGFRTPSDWSPDGQSVITGQRELRSWPVDATPERDASRIVLKAPEGNLWEARYSPNGRWLTFVNSQRRSTPNRGEVGVTSVDGPISRTWTVVGADRTWADKPRWSSDGKALYFLGNEGGHIEVWRAAFDPDRGIPTGPSVQLSRFESPSFGVSRNMSTMSWSVAGQKVYITMVSTSGSVWTLDNADK